ncbi:MAG TPA: YitT family protein [Acholeplasmataceae bacterium]|nr:YitT family protein [Acholeplasmataceae bacterium]
MNKAKWREIIEITAGVVLLSAGFYFFLLPLNMVIGGVMGISVIIQEIIPVSIFMYIANIILLLIGWLVLGKVFFMKTALATILSPTIIWVLEHTVPSDFFMRHMTESPLLIGASFGGLFLGVGLGIVIRNNATTGGMDVIQNIMHKYLHIPFSTAMYITDGIIIGIAMIINFQLGLYAVGSMIISGVLIDRLSIEGKAGYTVFIVTSFTEKIQEQIYEKLERGITQVKVIGGYSKKEKDMIICTVDRAQLYIFKRIIKLTDPKAFTFVTRTKEALGEGFSREGAVW